MTNVHLRQICPAIAAFLIAAPFSHAFAQVPAGTGKSSIKPAASEKRVTPQPTITPLVQRPASAEELVESARGQLQSGEAARALALAQQAQRVDPANYKAPYYIALALMTLGDLEGAQEAHHKSLALALSNEQKLAVNALGATIVAQGQVVEADKAAEQGLHGKAARLYSEAFAAGLPRPELALKAASIYEQRLNDVHAAFNLLNGVRERHSGTPAATEATNELMRLKPALSKLAAERVVAAQKESAARKTALLEEALHLDPGNVDALIALSAEAAAGTNWAQLESRFTALQQRNLLEQAIISRRLPLGIWPQDARLQQFFEDAWGRERAAAFRTRIAKWRSLDTFGNSGFSRLGTTKADFERLVREQLLSLNLQGGVIGRAVPKMRFAYTPFKFDGWGSGEYVTIGTRNLYWDGDGSLVMGGQPMVSPGRPSPVVTGYQETLSKTSEMCQLVMTLYDNCELWVYFVNGRIRGVMSFVSPTKDPSHFSRLVDDLREQFGPPATRVVGKASKLVFSTNRHEMITGILSDGSLTIMYEEVTSR